MADESTPGAGRRGRAHTLLEWQGSPSNEVEAKYLIGRDGKVIAFYPSKVAPESGELHQAIETALAATP